MTTDFSSFLCFLYFFKKSARLNLYILKKNMEDFIWKYKKYTLIQNLAIITASIFLAFAINVVISWWNFSNYIKASILDSQTKQQKSDIYLEHQGSHIFINSRSPIENIKQIQFSLLYNSININPENIINNIDNYVINYKYLDTWILNIQIIWDGKSSVWKWENISSIKFSKETEALEYINILNVNFTDTEWKTYIMTSSWVQL